MGVAVVGETSSLTGEFIGETHRVLEHTQNHPSRNQHQKGPICLWVLEEVTKTQLKAEQAPLFPLRTPPPPHQLIQHRNAATWVVSPGEYFRFHPLQYNSPVETKIHGPNETTDQSSKNRGKSEGYAK